MTVHTYIQTLVPVHAHTHTLMFLYANISVFMARGGVRVHVLARASVT